MATMILKRLPNPQDANDVGIELESICEAFDKKATSPFTAQVEITQDGFSLDGWLFTKLETTWYQVVQ